MPCFIAASASALLSKAAVQPLIKATPKNSVNAAALTARASRSFSGLQCLPTLHQNVLWSISISNESLFVQVFTLIRPGQNCNRH